MFDSKDLVLQGPRPRVHERQSVSSRKSSKAFEQSISQQQFELSLCGIPTSTRGYERLKSRLNDVFLFLFVPLFAGTYLCTLIIGGEKCKLIGFDFSVTSLVGTI